MWSRSQLHHGARYWNVNYPENKPNIMDYYETQPCFWPRLGTSSGSDCSSKRFECTAVSKFPAAKFLPSTRSTVAMVLWHHETSPGWAHHTKVSWAYEDYLYFYAFTTLVPLSALGALGTACLRGGGRGKRGSWCWTTRNSRWPQVT